MVTALVGTELSPLSSLHQPFPGQGVLLPSTAWVSSPNSSTPELGNEVQPQLQGSSSQGTLHSIPLGMSCKCSSFGL